MKILLIAQQSPHLYPIPAYGFWADSLRRGLAEAGHAVCEVNGADWAKGLLPLTAADRAKWKDETWTKTVETVKVERPDLLLGYFFPTQVEANAIEEIKRLGVPAVNFFCDHVRDFTDAPEEFAPFDLHWVPEKRAVSWYQKRGWKCVHAPMPTWVSAALRKPSKIESFPATFIGTADSLRKDLLGRAVRAGAEIEIRGAAWKNKDLTPNPSHEPASVFTQLSRQLILIQRQGWRAPLHKWSYRKSGDDYAAEIARQLRPAPRASDDVFQILRHSRVAIGINRYPSFRYPFSKPDVYSRLRDIEGPLAGACYLTEWTEDLPHWYDLGQEIETYRNADELVSKLKALQADPGRRERLRVKGQAKAANELTIPRSLQKIALALGLSQ